MKNYRKTTFLILLMVFGFIVQDATAQLSMDHITEQEDFPKKRKKRGEEEKDKNENTGIFFGGNVGGGYSNGLFLNLSPTVGYQFNERLRAAAGLDFYYYNISDNLNTIVDKTTSFGPFAYVQYLVFNGIYAQTQYQFVNYKQTFRGNFEDFSANENLLFLGAGYSSNSFQKGVGFNISALYNVLHDDNSIYADPFVFSIGIIYR